MEGLLVTAMNNLVSIGVVTGTGYILVKLVGDYQVRSTHRKIVAWGYDSKRIQWTGGAETFEDWLKGLPDSALESPTHLAKEAAVGANIIIHGSLSTDSVARLGVRLQQTWGYMISIEKERRAAARRG